MGGLLKGNKMKNLERFEYVPEEKSSEERIFFGMLVMFITIFVVVGLYFSTVKPMIKKYQETKRVELTTSFLFKEKKVEKIVPKKKKVVKKAIKKVVDLTKKPVIKQKVEKKEKVTPTKKVRRVFGVKKVFSAGLGSGGSMDNSIVNKVGNTVDKEYDDVKATKSDLKGRVAPLSKITSTPKMSVNVKPEYTDEMKENEVEGIIKAKILVDIDGKVKKAKILNDLGYGSLAEVKKACYKLLFKPALENSVPVAVWIIVKFNLQLRT